MSVLTDSSMYATSSRVRGVYRYLLQRDGRRESRERLEKVLSPESLIRGDDAESKGRGMVKGTINECIKMNLLTEDRESGNIEINPELPSDARSKNKGDALLPFTLTRLMLTTDNESNRNLSLVITWYLTQDAYESFGGWQETEAKLRQQVGSDLLGMNDARYSQFVDWVCFLGFAWRHNLKEKDLITPDPTAYLRGALSTLIDKRKGEPVPLADFMNRLAAQCPIFETGRFRVDIERNIGGRATEQHLSSTTSLALLRLQEEKLIELTKRSDALVYVLPDGDQNQSHTHIRRI